MGDFNAKVRCTQARKATHDLEGQIKTRTGLPIEESIRMTEDGYMEKVRPWCGQPSDRGRLKNSSPYLLPVVV